MMKVAVLAMALALAGCASTSAVRTKAEATTDANGWRVDCRSDQYTNERTCFAGTFGKGARSALSFFQIAYVNGKGPHLFVPHDFPGRTPTVRVDNGAVLTDPKAIVSALSAGSTAYVVFHVWPTGEDRMSVSTAGFASAYQRLQGML